MGREDSYARELREKYQALLAENAGLREENRLLRARLGAEAIATSTESHHEDAEVVEATCTGQTIELAFPSEINNLSEAREKIRLFMSLFSGREDVYARRWENKKKGTSGYSPYCLNEWKPVCAKSGSRGILSPSPHTTRRAGPHRAVRGNHRAVAGW